MKDKLLRVINKVANKLWSYWRKGVVPVIDFTCSLGGFYITAPIALARAHRPEWFNNQIREAKEAKAPGDKVVKFVSCPGMFDLLQYGYVIRAHSDIRIRATKMSCQVQVVQTHGFRNLDAGPMNHDVVKGIAPYRGVKPNAWKVPMPWGVHLPPGYTGHYLPAFLHSPELSEFLFIYPGTVDGDEFNTCNFIFSVVAPCDFTIPEGTPLIHVIPSRREDFHATSGPADKLHRDRHLFGFGSRVPGAYRRRFHKKKLFTIEVKK